MKLIRTLHIYLTMLGLVMTIFFAFTGFMLNHETWFEAAMPFTITKSGALPQEIAAKRDKFTVVEKLRSDFGVTGAVTGFDDADVEKLVVTFKSPGRHAEATIDSKTGETEVVFESRGLAGRMTELHRGTDAGKGWSLVIDAVAILLAFGAISGLILWWTLPKRRVIGTFALVGSIIVCLLVYLMAVP